jgi:hypothetical protein
MGRNVTCETCGETYYSVSDHECPGTPTERIEQLEARTRKLEAIVEILVSRSGGATQALIEEIE